MEKGEQQEMGAQKAGQRVEFSPVSSGELWKVIEEGEEPGAGVGHAEVDKADRSREGWSLSQGLGESEEAPGRGLVTWIVAFLFPRTSLCEEDVHPICSPEVSRY